MTDMTIEQAHAKRIANRLRELSRAVADGNRSEFNMRVPAEPERDADLVLQTAAQIIDTLLAATDPAKGTVPEGYVLVPAAPTHEMVQAGALLVKKNSPFHTGTLDIYLAMLAAAPQTAANAFTGRRTARNDPSIPTDAGVPPRGDAQDGGE